MSWFRNPLDEQLFHFINRDATNPIFDIFFPFITDLHKSAVFLTIAGLALILWIFRSRRTGLSALLCLVVAVAAADLIAYRVFKQSIERPRPAAAGLDPILRSPHHSGSSFPSNHAANVFAAATVLSAFVPQARLIFYGAAGSVAYSRVYVGVHYPSDVLAGSFLGWLIGRVTTGFLHLFMRRRSRSL